MAGGLLSIVMHSRRKVIWRSKKRWLPICATRSTEGEHACMHVLRGIREHFATTSIPPMSALGNGRLEDYRTTHTRQARKQRQYMPLQRLENRRGKRLLIQHPIAGARQHPMEVKFVAMTVLVHRINDMPSPWSLLSTNHLPSAANTCSLEPASRNTSASILFISALLHH